MGKKSNSMKDRVDIKYNPESSYIKDWTVTRIVLAKYNEKAMEHIQIN
jgi:hypothetical protein